MTTHWVLVILFAAIWNLGYGILFWRIYTWSRVVGGIGWAILGGFICAKVIP